ncbi:MAG TPA: aminopeptidase [Planctomycetota bacterium]|nr:aminopeptidase [Planctomycetota bacterium]
MRRLVALLFPLAFGGCYLLKQAGGQIDILLHSRDVEEMLADPSVPPATKEKLRLVRDIKEFGEREMGLTPSANYTTFYDTVGRPVTFIVTACAKDSFRPYTWWFPIVGDVPYKGFFNRDDAVAEARALRAEGYDVSLGSAAAYSTLGYFKDPVLSTMLDIPAEHLAALILHELTHGTIFLPGGADFNEGLASFVGWQGALEFARRSRGTGSAEYDRTVEAFAQEQQRDARALGLFASLDRLYRSSVPRETKLAERERIFAAFVAQRRAEAEGARDALHRRRGSEEERAAEAARVRQLEAAVPDGPVNNAAVLNQRRYGRYETFRERFDRAGGDWRAFFLGLRREPVTPGPSPSADSAPSPP